MNLITKKDFNDLCLSILSPLKEKYSAEYAKADLGATATTYEDITVSMLSHLSFQTQNRLKKSQNYIL